MRLTCYCNFSADDGVHCGSPISDHEQKFTVWKQFSEVGSGLESERIFVAESGSRFTMSGNHLQDEGGDGGGEDVVSKTSLLQSHALLL